MLERPSEKEIADKERLAHAEMGGVATGAAFTQMGGVRLVNGGDAVAKRRLVDDVIVHQGERVKELQAAQERRQRGMLGIAAARAIRQIRQVGTKTLAAVQQNRTSLPHERTGPAAGNVPFKLGGIAVHECCERVVQGCLEIGKIHRGAKK